LKSTNLQITWRHDGKAKENILKNKNSEAVVAITNETFSF